MSESVIKTFIRAEKLILWWLNETSTGNHTEVHNTMRVFLIRKAFTFLDMKPIKIEIINIPHHIRKVLQVQFNYILFVVVSLTSKFRQFEYFRRNHDGDFTIRKSRHLLLTFECTMKNDLELYFIQLSSCTQLWMCHCQLFIKWGSWPHSLRTYRREEYPTNQEGTENLSEHSYVKNI